jgi:ATP-dependent protease HslVU (ClpYQ) peptidase subunit
MTIIAYRDGVMAGDTQVQCGIGLRTSATYKIFRSNDGDYRLGGAAGLYSSINRFRIWLETGAHGDFDPKCGNDGFHALLVDASGNVFTVEDDGSAVLQIAPYHAVGIGRSVALGAMFAGADAELAAKAAIVLHTGCGGGIQIERL